jgi:hypothetical protein
MAFRLETRAIRVFGVTGHENTPSVPALLTKLIVYIQ